METSQSWSLLIAECQMAFRSQKLDHRRESSVAPTYRNPTHGTFVAGLICWPSQLNPTLAGIDDSPCGIFDLQVMPNLDPNYRRDTETITEQEFLISLRTALDQYANRYKVWNLSIGTTEVCSLDEFSSFAEQLDNLQERYKVSFVISAGNYERRPCCQSETRFRTNRRACHKSCR